MGRPIEHDANAVRAAALRAFLRAGYAETSLSDLEAATGVGRRSLYNSFGGKRGMFLRALQDFRDTVIAANLAPLAAHDGGRRGVEAMLHGLLALAETEDGRLGCLICNTAREPIAAQDADVAAHIAGYFADMHGAFARALQAGLAAGETPVDADIKGLADFFTGVVVSVSVMARAGAPLDALKNVIAHALKRLD